MIRLVAFIFLLLSAPTTFYAQENKQTLADIRPVSYTHLTLPTKA